MKKEGISVKFYESNWILAVWLILIGELLLLFGYALISLSCPSLIIKSLIFGPFVFALFVFLFLRFVSTKKGLVTIDKNGISFSGSQFSWSEITRVKLEFRNWKRSFLRLRVEWKNIPYFIDLAFVTDIERRLLLDEIEKYISIQYVKCRYERNYTFWDIAPLIVVLILIQVVFIFGYIL